jgi:hypothetical protein
VGELKGLFREASVPWLDDDDKSAANTDDVIHRIDDLIYAIRNVWIGSDRDDIPDNVEDAEENIRDAIVTAIVDAERLMSSTS